MQILPRILVSLMCLFGLVPLSADTPDDPLAQARESFLEARKALNDNRIGDYNKLAGQLKDYPLLPYLEYQQLRKHLNTANHRKVATFIERYEDQPLSDLMRRRWLHVLAKQHNWKRFLPLYQGKQSVRLQCYRLQAKLRTRNTTDLDEETLQLWLIGHSQDNACDPVFVHLENKGVITQELLWQRIRLAMQKGNPSLAAFLAKRLPAADRAWVSLWRETRQRPASMLTSKQLARDIPITREIIIYALHRIARHDLHQARNKWTDIKTRYAFDEVASAELERSFALSAAWRRYPEAHAWLVAVPEVAVNPQVIEWRTRTAIANGNWKALLQHTASMSAEDIQREEWRYWQARALQETGENLKASEQLARLAKERDYHGFLAADDLHWPYEMGDRPLDVTSSEVEQLSQLPGFVRARELYRAKLWLEARREWHHAIKDLSNEQLKQAAELAHQWGWHDRAILTVARAKEYDDLSLRFPLEHKDRVTRQAKASKLDSGHIFAVIRQESAFNKKARSPAGAMGLMQLMPKTGRVTARKYSIPLGGLHDLYQADKNIRIGSAYLKQVMDKYDRNIVLASAAYNAGPHRVKRWLPEDGKQQAERWIAMIPFNETRKYVQRVLTYSAIYDWRLQQPVITLNKHMPDIYPHERYAD